MTDQATGICAHCADDAVVSSVTSRSSLKGAFQGISPMCNWVRSRMMVHNSGDADVNTQQTSDSDALAKEMRK
jgi:hypothetical protein